MKITQITFLLNCLIIFFFFYFPTYFIGPLKNYFYLRVLLFKCCTRSLKSKGQIIFSNMSRIQTPKSHGKHSTKKEKSPMENSNGSLYYGWSPHSYSKGSHDLSGRRIIAYCYSANFHTFLGGVERQLLASSYLNFAHSSYHDEQEPRAPTVRSLKKALQLILYAHLIKRVVYW